MGKKSKTSTQRDKTKHDMLDKKHQSWLSIKVTVSVVVGIFAVLFNAAIVKHMNHDGILSSRFSSRFPNAKFRALVEWLELNGGHIDENIAFRETLHGVRLFYNGLTTNEVETGLMFEIPESCLLSSKSKKSIFGATVKDPELLKAILKHEVVDQTLLALVIVAEKHNPDSFWRPYLDTLLPTENTQQPLLWEPEKLKEHLQSPLIIQETQGILNYIESKVPLLHWIDELYPDLLPDDSSILIRDFKWAYAIASAHVFNIPDRVNGEEYRALVPIGSLPDHSFDREVETIRITLKDVPVDEERAITGRLTRNNIVHGEELVTQYQSEFSPLRYLNYHGIVDEDYENRFEDDFLILRLSVRDLKVFGDGTVDLDRVMDVLGEEARELFLEDLTRKVREAIAALPTSLDEDKVLLHSPGTDVSTPRSALLIRIRFKQILHKLLKWLTEGSYITKRRNTLDSCRGGLYLLDMSNLLY